MHTMTRTCVNNTQLLFDVDDRPRVQCDVKQTLTTPSATLPNTSTTTSVSLKTLQCNMSLMQQLKHTEVTEMGFVPMPGLHNGPVMLTCPHTCPEDASIVPVCHS